MASTAFALAGVKMLLPDATGGFRSNEKPADLGAGGMTRIAIRTDREITLAQRHASENRRMVGN
jgi:hypothetical protein